VKRFFLYSLLIIYVTVQLKPLTAVIHDVLAHTFWKVQHMATVHYENGHYHLHAELKTISEEDSANQEKIPNSEKSDSDTFNQISQQFNHQFFTGNVVIPGVIKAEQEILTGYLNIHAPPPKA
jgi:hypothetical protein